MPRRRTGSSSIPALCGAVMMLTWAAGPSWSQVRNTQEAQDDAPPPQAPLTGPQILSFSTYEGFFSHGVPETVVGFQGLGANLPADSGIGASVEFGWSKFTERTTFDLTYTPSYSADLRYSSLDALNHAASLNFRRKLTHRFTLGFTGAFNYSTLEESLFASTGQGDVASVPSNFSQLSSGLLSGDYTNNQQLGVALTNPSLAGSPLTNLLYGQRVLTASGQSTLTYSISPRMSVTFNGGYNRTQYESQGQATPTGNQALVPNTTLVSGGAVLIYHLTHATEIGTTVTSDWVSSSLADFVSTTSTATYGRTIASRWIIQAHAGIGVISPVGGNTFAVQNEIVVTSARPVFGGSVAYKSHSHTFLGEYDRSTANSYGLGAETTSSSAATYQWHQPGSRWALRAGFSWQQLAGNGVLNTSGWHVTASVRRGFGPHLSLICEYTYLDYSGGLQTAFYSFAESALRFTLEWTRKPNMLR